MIIGNKTDLERQVSTQEGIELAKKEGTLFFEISSKTNDNVFSSLFESIAHFQYFNQFKINKKKLASELLIENTEGLQSDPSPQQKLPMPKSTNKCNC